MSTRGTIAIAGSIAQKPGQAGHTWQFLQYLLGFRRLGWDVLLLDWLEPAMCFDRHRRPVSCERSENVRYLVEVMERFGLADAYSLAIEGGPTLGLPRAKVLERLKSSAALINVMGFLDDEELLGAAPLRVFMDTDPGFGQMWHDLGWADVFSGHDLHLTIAERIGEPDCEIPRCGIDWLTFHQPVMLECWLTAHEPLPGAAFTSIGSWRGPYDAVNFHGKRYGLRVHEFRRFADLPRRVGAAFQIALDIDPVESSDLDLLAESGWRLVDPAPIGATPISHRNYVRASRGEFLIAKEMYVATRSGWFSERSICYLASGRPVIAQDTVLEGLYPLGRGLLTFSTLDEAVACVEEVEGDYRRHARAARELAHEHFDSDKVLTGLLDKLGVGS